MTETEARAFGGERMIQKPNMITMPAHPTNQWSRYGLPFDYFDRFGVNYDD